MSEAFQDQVLTDINNIQIMIKELGKTTQELRAKLLELEDRINKDIYPRLNEVCLTPG